MKCLGQFLPGFPGSLDGKAPACNAGDPGLIPGSERSPGEGNGNSLQYSSWENLWTDESGRLQSTGLQKSQIQWLNNNKALKVNPKHIVWIYNCSVSTFMSIQSHKYRTSQELTKSDDGSTDWIFADFWILYLQRATSLSTPEDI